MDKHTFKYIDFKLILCSLNTLALGEPILSPTNTNINAYDLAFKNSDKLNLAYPL